MRIYLDCCCIQRPFDDQTQPRIKVETEAVLAILASVQTSDISLISSEALEYEISRIPDTRRRNEVLAILSLANERLEVTQEVVTLAQSLESRGIPPMDSVHLALASTARVDYFGTCDDKLLRRGQADHALGCNIVSALNLMLEVLK